MSVVPLPPSPLVALSAPATGSLQRYEKVSHPLIGHDNGAPYLDSVTHLTAVVALHLRPVGRLWALAGQVTFLLAVATGDEVGVARLVALLGDMICGAAVAASTSLDVVALSKVSRKAGRRRRSTYIAREVTGLVALSALDTFS